MQAKCNQFDAGYSWTERIRKKQGKPQKTGHAGNYFLQAPNAKTSGMRRCDIQGRYPKLIITYYNLGFCGTFGGIGGDGLSVLFQTKQGKKSLQEAWRIDDGQSDLTNKTSSTEIQLIATTET